MLLWTSQRKFRGAMNFSYELIHAVSASEEESLKRELNNLVNAEILYRKLLFGKESYIFKHALIQDVAYESILKS